MIPKRARRIMSRLTAEAPRATDRGLDGDLFAEVQARLADRAGERVKDFGHFRVGWTLREIHNGPDGDFYLLFALRRCRGSWGQHVWQYAAARAPELVAQVTAERARGADADA